MGPEECVSVFPNSTSVVGVTLPRGPTHARRANAATFARTDLLLCACRALGFRSRALRV